MRVTLMTEVRVEESVKVFLLRVVGEEEKGMDL